MRTRRPAPRRLDPLDRTAAHSPGCPAGQGASGGGTDDDDRRLARGRSTNRIGSGQRTSWWLHACRIATGGGDRNVVGRTGQRIKDHGRIEAAGFAGIAFRSESIEDDIAQNALWRGGYTLAIDQCLIRRADNPCMPDPDTSRACPVLLRSDDSRPDCVSPSR